MSDLVTGLFRNASRPNAVFLEVARDLFGFVALNDYFAVLHATSASAVLLEAFGQIFDGGVRMRCRKIGHDDNGFTAAAGLFASQAEAFG